MSDAPGTAGSDQSLASGITSPAVGSGSATAAGVTGPAAGGEPGETQVAMLNRNLAELLQELRVAEVGVQILFAFLLTLPFTQRFTKLDHFQRGVYFTTLMVAVGSSALFIAPAAFHRIVFHHRDRPAIIRYTSKLLLAGIVMLLLAFSGAVLLVTDFLFGNMAGALAATAVAVWCITFWFVIPLVSRLRADRA